MYIYIIVFTEYYYIPEVLKSVIDSQISITAVNILFDASQGYYIYINIRFILF